MSIKTLAFSLFLAFAMASPTLAKPKTTCGVGSKYELVDKKLVPYGMATDQVVENAKKSFKDADVQKVGNGVLVSFKRPYNNLDYIAFYTRHGVVTRILFSYHSEFINSLGGLKDSLTILAQKLMEKYGKADSVDTSGEGGKFSATWGESGGVSLNLVLKQPSTLVLRFDCTSLEKELLNQAVKSTNFGF